MSISPLFVDGIGRVLVANGVTYIDLVSIEPPNEPGAQPEVIITQRLVLTLPHFVRMCTEMTRHLEALQHKGIISPPQPSPSS